jgi:hypothetical protein
VSGIEAWTSRSRPQAESQRRKNHITWSADLRFDGERGTKVNPLLRGSSEEPWTVGQGYRVLPLTEADSADVVDGAHAIARDNARGLAVYLAFTVRAERMPQFFVERGTVHHGTAKDAEMTSPGQSIPADVGRNRRARVMSDSE